MMNESLKLILPNPIEIVKALDLRVIGQHQAKRELSLLLLNRAVRRLHDNNIIHLTQRIPKPNLLLLGPTGVGKTSLIHALGEVADLPISVNDVTSITAAGYIGAKVEDFLSHHVNITQVWLENNNTRLNEIFGVDVDSEPQSFEKERILLREHAENGIVYLDEIDKIRQRGDDKDVNGEMVQNELLRILDKGLAVFGNGRYGTNKCRLHDLYTDNIIFILGGAFSDLGEIIFERLNKTIGIGFTMDLKDRLNRDDDKDLLFKFVTTEDLIKYGFKPEFLGRIPAKAVLSPVTVPMLKQIMHTPKNSIVEQYTSLFDVLGIKLIIEEEALDTIAEEAIKLKTGARSLRTLFNTVFSPYLYSIFENDEKEITLTKDDVLQRLHNNV